NDPNLRVSITAPAGDATNIGQLIASSGSLGLFGTVVRNSGIVNADSATLQGGKIVFKASQRVEAGGTISAQGAGGGTISMLADMQDGTVNVSGTLDASAPVSGNGGYIDTSAAHVQVADTAHITTAAANGSTGTWLIDPFDFTIDAGGDITGAALSSLLGSNNVTISTIAGTPSATNLYGSLAGNGDIIVNEAVDWISNTLTLSAERNININANLSSLVGGPPGSLVLEYGQGAVASGNTSFYKLAPGVQVNLRAGSGFSTKLGWDGTPIIYTVITTLGLQYSATGTDLQGMNLAGNYVLGSDIDALATSGWNDALGVPIGFAPIGTASPTWAPFTGQFDGLGHTISNLYINRPTETNVGLFGYANGASIRNVALTGANITGLNDVGGLVGQIYGTISNSSASGIVKGSYGVGGLAGYNSGTISDSFAAGTVSGISNVGGLAGYSYGTIGNSYVSSGSVTGTSYVGGLVGSNNSGVLKNSHYDITNVLINAGSYVTLGGLYNAAGAGQYNDWITHGLKLDILNYSGAGKSLELIGGAYTIKDVQGLKDLLGFADNAAYTFTLGNSIVLSTNDAGLYIPYLAADFNGNNLTVSNLNVSLANDNLGLFGNIAATATVSNVVLSDAVVTGRSNIGALAGLNQGTISGSHVDNSIGGSVSGTSNVGGLVGNNGGAISNSYVNNIINATVSGASNVGGLAGYNNGTISGSYVSGGSVNGSGWNDGGLVGYNRASSGFGGVRTNGIISNSYVSGGTVTGTDRVGGLVGNNDFGTIGNSHVDTGTIVNGGNYVGGLVGYDGGEGYIYGNTVTGTTVTGTSYVGGLAGMVAQARYFIGYADNNHVVNSSVSGGTGSSGLYVGGLMGWNDGIISNSYVSGGSVSGGSNVGGLVGYNSPVGSTSISSMPVIYGGRISTSYASGGTVTGSTDVGGLVGNNAGSISGSHVDNNIAGNVTGSSNVGGLAGNNVGVVSGSYVSGGTVTGSSKVGGLVGLNGGTTIYAGIGTISNSYVNSGTVVSGSNNVGGLVGYNGGGTSAGVPVNTSTITGSYVSGGTVISSASSSSGNAGGLVGYNSGSISNSFASNGSVSVGTSVGTAWYMGGLVGNNAGTISNTYASGGTVSGNGSGSNFAFGGLAGYNSGSISNSYASTGVVGGGFVGGVVGNNAFGGTVSASFWNTSVAGVSVINGIGNDAAAYGGTNIGATGLTSAGMMTMSNFTAAGWSISNTYGTGSIWTIYEGTTMPLLSSFLVPPVIPPLVVDVVPNVLDQIVYITDQRNKLRP
ncbi:MAG: hypothetical protein M0P42_16140, partial [Gallionella sp.]|nr:hypothetical protein [Gallionella sp.]